MRTVICGEREFAADAIIVGVGIVPETTANWAAKLMAIKAVQLADPWALRDLSICVRDYKALPPYARQLVDHMREARREIT